MKSRANKAKGKAGRAGGQAKRPAEPDQPLSPGRKWLFRFIALAVLPVMLAVLAGGILELGLRLGGYGHDTHFFRRIQLGGKDYLLNNEEFTDRFFPEQLARWPDPFKMEVVKGPETVRIFIFGESAAMGDPQPAYGAGRYMEVLLRERFPQKKIEVINLGITAINSHVILPIARECVPKQGDFWIVYMGNNEMVGPFGAATVFGARALPRRAAQFNLAIQRTRAGQLLVSSLRRFGGHAQSSSWGGMEMFIQNQIAPDDARRKTVYENFEGNLRDIVQAGEDSGATLILNTVSVNLKDCPPFASMLNSNLPAADRLGFDQMFAEAKALQAQGNFQAAGEKLTAALKLEPQYAEASFRLGQCELALTNRDAKTEFQRACDADALPFRADTKINGIIRQVAQERAGDRLDFCDAEKLLAGSSPAGIAGDEIFWEHVHFNFEGNYRLGMLWAEQIAQRLSASGAKPGGPGWLSEEAVNRELGLSIWNRLFIVQAELARFKQPPLSTQFNNTERVRRFEEEEKELRRLQAQPGAVENVREGFAAELRRAPEDKYLYESLANFCEGIHDPQGAISAYRRMTELMPADYYACLQLGRLLGEQGKAQEGQAYLEEAVRLRPALPFGWLELGSDLSAQQKYPRALDCMERASRLRPDDYTYVCSTGQLLGKLDRHSEAIAHFQRAIQLNPAYWQAHCELAGEYSSASRLGDAAREYGTALNINPNYAPSHVNLGLVLVRLNQPEEAAKCFLNALKLEPGNRTARESLDTLRANNPQKPW